MGLHYSSSSSSISKAFSDADYASCPHTRPSTTGFVYFLVTFSSRGSRRSNQQYLTPPLKSNIRQCLPLVVKSFGCNTYCKILVFPYPLLLHYTVAKRVWLKLLFHERIKHIDMDSHLLQKKVRTRPDCTSTCFLQKST